MSATAEPPTPPTQAAAAATPEESKENKAASSNPEAKTPNSDPEAKTEQVKAVTKGASEKNAESKDPPVKKCARPRKKTSLMVAALQTENARLRKELTKAKDTIAKLKRGERVTSSVSKKAVAMGRSKVGRVSTRLYNPKHEQEKINKRATKKKQTELGKCSFKPARVARHSKNKEPGTLAFSRLYLDADRLAKKKAEKAQEDKEAKVRRFSFTPEVSEKSRKLQASVSRKERMYRLAIPKPRAEPNTPSMQKEDLIECTFKPRINPENNSPILDVPLHQRLYKAGLDMQEKMQKKRELKLNKDYEKAMGACTFRPDVGSSGGPTKTVEEMQTVINRLAVTDVERRLDNLNACIKEETLGMRFAPEISQLSIQMAGSRTGDVTERLYTVKLSVENAPLDDECTFTPDITQMAFEVDRSELPVHERLSLHRSPSQREAFADMNEYDGYEEEEESEEEEEYEEGEEEEEIEGEEDEAENEGGDEDITF